MDRLQELAGFAIVPGTLNVRLREPLQRGPGWRYVAASEISANWEVRAGQRGYYLARVMIAHRHRGLAFQADEPEGPGYPPDQIELFCEVLLRPTLGLVDGDRIDVSLHDHS